ncbi:hypothetical protein BKA67DRAFT_514796 [Truncatella angustata]|uniref:sn-1-specific diacylglycerol lipase n=1 Tax=Truncatella angustata TaxID=152316 RepID=A0A9P8USC7_9PEZI|nr:uncharacterized protein BKA67DRAFT_514796 [Truncatella angustata]KAH6657464.1 hypothetical protein BKA67DRAFT_514796 [Truncatella angustata]
MEAGEVEFSSPRAALAAAEKRNSQEQASLSTAPSRTLLPGPVASIVSLATRSTSFALRLGSVIGGYGIGAAKITTLSSLELGRGILEGILSRAGKDVLARSQSELGRENAETILERSLESLHRTMLHVVFWTNTGFQVTETTVSSISQLSQLLLSSLDQFFGSTDSSRAIASIITLVRHEFRNPATGVQGEKVGVTDLVLGLCGLAYLQNTCSRTIQEEARRLGHEEIVWDVVVLNDGTRADVYGDSHHSTNPATKGGEASNSQLIKALEKQGAHESSSEDDLPEMDLRRQILGRLPKDAKVSISTSTTTTKIITIEVQGDNDPPLLAPPGADLIEREVTLPDRSSFASQDTPTYRLVYRISRERERSSIIQQSEANIEPACFEVGEEGNRPTSHADLSEKGPPVPPKPRQVAAPHPREARETQALGTGSSASEVPTSPRARASQIPVSTKSPENAANQKRTRRPPESNASPIVGINSQSSSATTESKGLTTSVEKRNGLRDVLRKSPMTGFSNLMNRGTDNGNAMVKARLNSRSSSRGDKSTRSKAQPNTTLRVIPNSLSTRDFGISEAEGTPLGIGSKSNYAGQQHRRRNSIASQTDTLSVHSVESRPGSPTVYRSSHMSKTRSGDDFLNSPAQSPTRYHNRARSQRGVYSPSIHTLQASSSQTSLVLSSYQQKSAYSDSEAVDTLRRTGMINGMFPEFHILRNITRYSRYASAAYGSRFLNLMGIAKEKQTLNPLEETHQDVRSFSHHTELPPDSVLLSSFVDPQGGSDATGSTDTGVPLVHTIAIDRESKAVVLACRGTLGFEDVLADMMCDYDDLKWRGKAYKVHKGIHASARRLLYGGDGRVLYTLKEALEEFPGFGLVLCGHSLGGAVAALLGAMLAEPATTGTAFVTSAQQHKRLLAATGITSQAHEPIYLPAGRPIHVFAYGPPATMSPAFRMATRGLITSIVHGNDLVPFLSLGVLHDLQALSLAFKTDNDGAKAEIRQRIWQHLQTGLSDKWYNNAPKLSTEDEDQWAFAALKTLRASMMSSKLLPPGEVFAVESTPALRRDAFTKAGENYIGRSATRIVLKYIRDAENHFREIKFGASMLTDHSPGRYEDALRRLALGVM